MDLFSLYPKWTPWFYVFVFFGIIAAAVSAVIEEWDKSWIKLFGLFGNGVFGLVIFIWTFFTAIDRIMSIYQNYLENGKKKDREYVQYLISKFGDACKRQGVNWNPSNYLIKEMEKDTLHAMEEERKNRTWWSGKTKTTKRR